MPNCTEQLIEFPGFSRRKIEADFSGGAITSDAGVLLLRQIDQRLGLTQAVAEVFTDPRRANRVRHQLSTLLRQRIYGLALGYEDLNDHNTLRSDLALQTAVNQDQDLASASTLCRFEQRADRALAWRLHEVLVDQFIASFKRVPRQLILDIDATDDKVHGNQQGKFFHGYYDAYCFLPLYIFCAGQLLVSYLRPSKIDGAKHAWAILALLVKRLRQRWPKVKIIVRGDSGFCRWKLLSWCERNRVDYIIGLARNSRLQALLQPQMDQAQQQSTYPVRRFTEFDYAAGTWNRPRRVIAKAEITEHGPNPRFVVTSLSGPPKRLYETLYCARGNMENRIKEQQLDLFADRTSCHKWWPNQLRLLLSSLAYTLIEAIRRLMLPGTELARACAGTIRLKLFKIGAVVIRNTRRVRMLMSSTYPYQDLYRLLCARLIPD